jgi:hypothetical protein
MLAKQEVTLARQAQAEKRFKERERKTKIVEAEQQRSITRSAINLEKEFLLTSKAQD